MVKIGFKEKGRFRDREMGIILTDLSRLHAETKGDVTLVFHDKSSLTLKDFIHVPKMRKKYHFDLLSL